MSSKKIKSLKLQRSQRCETQTKVEDTSMLLAEETKTHVERIELSSKNREPPTYYSTPKRSPGKSSITKEQSSIEYRVSPILLPCTQDGGNEVAWDWQDDSLTKSNLKRNKNGVESIGTPKRTTALQKKRNSNSPLLYKPIKRKLMRNDYQQESIDKFTAEMKALSEQFKPAPRDEISNEKTSASEDDLMIQIDVDDFAESEIKFDFARSDDDNSRKKGEAIVKTSMDDLFDDSIEDSMIKCSQEVEEKLRLESCRENSANRNSASSTGTKDSPRSWHQQPYSCFPPEKEKSTNDTKNSSKSVSFGNSSKNSTGAATPAVSVPKSSCINNNVSKIEKTTQNDLFEIPDDSFDDFIAACDAVENPKPEQSSNQSSSRYGKFYASPHSSCANVNPRRFENSSARKVLLPPPAQSSGSAAKASSTLVKSGNAGKPFSRSASNDNIKPSSISASQKITTTKTNPGNRFFKTKSLSTSSFDEKNGNATNSSQTSKGWKSSMFATGSVSSSVSSNQRLKPVKSDFGGDPNAWQRADGKDGNRGICNVDRSGPREGGSFKLTKINGSVAGTATGSQSTRIFTPEEIERKRLEANMKLEAKRKLLGRSASTSSLSGGCAKKPVKR